MALENYVEMRDGVRSPHFARAQGMPPSWSGAFPDRFIPRYSMVMFHPEIPYRRGAAPRRAAAARARRARERSGYQLPARCRRSRRSPSVCSIRGAVKAPDMLASEHRRCRSR